MPTSLNNKILFNQTNMLSIDYLKYVLLSKKLFNIVFKNNHLYSVVVNKNAIFARVLRIFTFEFITSLSNLRNGKYLLY